MDETTYEISRNEYKGFLEQINPKSIYCQNLETDTYKIRKIFSKKTKKLLCKQCIPNSDEYPEQYYVYCMPDDDERQPPRAVRRIVLREKEEVQAFFDILNKIQKGETNDGTVS